MSKPKSAEEAKLPVEKMASFKGRPHKAEASVKAELPEGLRVPSATGEKSMGGVVKGRSEDEMSGHMGHHGMSHARKQLERETERKEHSVEVGGHVCEEHSGRHGHKA